MMDKDTLRFAEPLRIVCRGGPKDGWAFDVFDVGPPPAEFVANPLVSSITYKPTGEIDPETGREIYVPTEPGSPVHEGEG